MKGNTARQDLVAFSIAVRLTKHDVMAPIPPPNALLIPTANDPNQILIMDTTEIIKPTVGIMGLTKVTGITRSSTLIICQWDETTGHAIANTTLG